MFGSNSSRYSERAPDHRVRLAHPDSQIQLSNSVGKYSGVAYATALNCNLDQPRRQPNVEHFGRMKLSPYLGENRVA